MITVRGLHKWFGDLHVLDGVDLQIAQRQALCVIGPSGSGKSTLLRCINLLVRPDAGDILLEGVRINSPEIRPEWVRQRIGMVFQQFNLFTHLTALKNVMLGLTQVKKMDRSAAETKAKWELDRVGLGDKVHAYPAQLSGGQQQLIFTPGSDLRWLFIIWTAVALVYFVMTYAMTTILAYLERRVRVRGLETMSI